MKRISLFLCAALLAVPALSPAQDAATEERLNRLNAQIDVLMEAKESLTKKIDDLGSQIRDLQNAVSKPTGNYASADDVKQLADKLKEIDQKRQQDNEQILKTLQSLRTSLTTGSSSRRGSSTSTPTPVADTGSPRSDKGYEYVVKQGDSLAAIVKAYRDNNIKVTLAQVEAANPELKPENLKVGQKIFIPAPAQ